METNIIIAIAIFTLAAWLIWRMTIGSFRKEYGEKRRKLWGQRVFYWQDVVFFSTGITFLVLVFLKWANMLTA
jgi:hypothetical protein